jgi:hypothetical protein
VSFDFKLCARVSSSGGIKNAKVAIWFASIDVLVFARRKRIAKLLAHVTMAE